MTKALLLAFASLVLLATPAIGQDWGSGYNMGSIGVSGGTESTGSIVIDCAEGGNGVVEQGALAIFLKPAAANAKIKASPAELTFSVDGRDIILPVGADEGDGFVFDKTPETLAPVTELIALLKTGETLTVRDGDSEIAAIGLNGAAAALDGVEACLTP